METVEKEPIIFVIGIGETGDYEIQGFYLASKESHNFYLAVVKDLYEGGVMKLLLFLADVLLKLDDKIRKVFPLTDFQMCTIHASRNFESEVGEMDKELMDKQLKTVFVSDTKEEALIRLNEVKSQ
ncbi:MAG: transposase [Candidatus Thermoplasmatota archaeon]|jgi:transposase-like protein|nr:transposase [Candidatus Thermoplasmatota archaeon]MCL6002164.1 transposase [Candidatus Thermoplasmatota archaeon]